MVRVVVRNYDAREKTRLKRHKSDDIRQQLLGRHGVKFRKDTSLLK